jgi:hypothetical protein
MKITSNFEGKKNTTLYVGLPKRDEPKNGPLIKQ